MLLYYIPDTPNYPIKVPYERKNNVRARARIESGACARPNPHNTWNVEFERAHPAAIELKIWMIFLSGRQKVITQVNCNMQSMAVRAKHWI